MADHTLVRVVAGKCARAPDRSSSCQHGHLYAARIARATRRSIRGAVAVIWLSLSRRMQPPGAPTLVLVVGECGRGWLSAHCQHCLFARLDACGGHAAAGHIGVRLPTNRLDAPRECATLPVLLSRTSSSSARRRARRCITSVSSAYGDAGSCGCCCWHACPCSGSSPCSLTGKPCQAWDDGLWHG